MIAGLYVWQKGKLTILLFLIVPHLNVSQYDNTLFSFILFSTWYFSTLISYRRRLDIFY